MAELPGDAGLLDCGRDPAANQAAAPWLSGLQLGYRIYLVLELLRLLAPG